MMVHRATELRSYGATELRMSIIEPTLMWAQFYN